VNPADPSNVTSLKASAQVKSLSWDPQGDYLAASCCDGSLRVWNLSTAEVVYDKVRAIN
jgi:WD40 repeat protein